MDLTRELVNIAPEHDPELWRRFSQACQRKKLDPDKLKARLGPVARSLGLSVYDSQQQDYYAFLGIDSSASPEDIRKAYHRKAKLLHPDTRKNGGNDQAFIQLADGYRVLKNTELRAHYDQSRQSMDAWCEGPACIDENRDEREHRSRRNRYILQLSGVVVLMVFAALIFNVIYESRAIKDGFYMAPESEKSVSDSSEKEIVEKSLENDRVFDRPRQDDSKGESSTPDLGERAASISSRGVDKKPNHVSAGIPNLHQKQVALKASSDAKDRSPASSVLKKRPGAEKGLSSLKKEENKGTIENKGYSGTNEQRGVVSQIQAGILTESEKKPIENKIPPLKEKNRAENDSGFDQQIRVIEADRDTAVKASALLQKFAEEEREIKRVSAFIRTYSETYEKKDYAKFSRLFTEDATENGRAFIELAPDYRRTFTVIEKLDYEIELHRTSLLVDQEVIRTEGIYRISWQPYNGMRKISEGPISFEIVKRNGEYRVIKLEYGQIKP